jgi:hypothetical protein
VDWEAEPINIADLMVDPWEAIRPKKGLENQNTAVLAYSIAYGIPRHIVEATIPIDDLDAFMAWVNEFGPPFKVYPKS